MSPAAMRSAGVGGLTISFDSGGALVMLDSTPCTASVARPCASLELSANAEPGSASTIPKAAKAAPGTPNLLITSLLRRPRHCRPPRPSRAPELRREHHPRQLHP